MAAQVMVVITTPHQAQLSPRRTPYQAIIAIATPVAAITPPRATWTWLM